MRAAAFVTALLFLPMQRRVAHEVGRVASIATASSRSPPSSGSRPMYWSGRRQPEEIEAVLQEVQDDAELVVQVRTASGWARLDGNSVTDPDGLALEAGGEVVAMIRLGWDSRRARRRVADVAKTAWVPIEVSRLRLDLRDALEPGAGQPEAIDDGGSRGTAPPGTRPARPSPTAHRRQRGQPATSPGTIAGPEAAELEATVRELRATVEELRRIAHGVRPTQLDDGLESALANVRETCPLPARPGCRPAPRGQRCPCADRLPRRDRGSRQRLEAR